ncbi:helix-turn-helix domain-containing protein [Pseudoalteromonas denitrificans]|uniref:Bacteriophage CI repressor helix-turn-helix domain-containing protein n=1 Tax=Pseudoalteromonas denitrificans DSM 6059 TaxID=1123010 RepID=A0A1I1TED7_9GAMM|nr:helix-turn-helix domain-containing protein [Pseudoalteromonas denitrificans]SFD54693.1 Bacteriophage CI repressor helix-turn-helix domain-containing protein [Pseudoalteromonas denitrificans DSM 6059]
MIVDSVKKVDVTNVIKKLHVIFNVTSDRALSTALGLSLGTVGASLKRNTLPWEGIITACLDKGISLDELFSIEVQSQYERKSTLVINQTKANLDVDQPATTTNVSTNKASYLEIDKMIESIMDEVLAPKNLSAERILLVRKSLRPVLVDAALEYSGDRTIVTAVARSTISLV